MNESNYYLLETSIDNLSDEVEGLKTIQSIMELCIQRIKMLKEIDQDDSKSTLENRVVDYEIIRVNNKFVQAGSPNYYIPREVISHFLCKMAYAFYAEPDQWDLFAKSEAIILFDKLKNQSTKINEYFSPQQLKIQKLSQNIYLQALPKIERVFNQKNLSEKDKEDSSKELIMLKFFDHPNLLKNCNIVLHKGYIIMKKIDTKLIIQNIFIERLLDEMKTLQQKFQNSGSQLDDDRLAFLKDLHKAEIYNDTTQFNSTSIHSYEIDKFAARDMPACMTYLMNALNEKHHLKHFGRLQLGLFLKGAGLPLNESLLFWQQRFSKISAEDFKKKYDYNIRHNYGKIGKQLDYTPMSCQKIIQAQPMNEEYHGCPYKNLESKKLKAFLKLNYNISEEDSQVIDNYKKTKNYQLACREVFKIKNQSKDRKPEDYQFIYEKVGNHPNAYFEQSFRIHEPHRFAQDEKKQNKSKTAFNNSSAAKQTARKNNEMDLEF